MNEQVKLLEKKGRLTDEDLAFLSKKKREANSEIEAARKDNVAMLTSLVRSLVGPRWFVGWDGEDGDASISLDEQNPIFGDIRFQRYGDTISLKLGNWLAFNPNGDSKTDLGGKERLEALQTIAANWGKIEEIMKCANLKEPQETFGSCRWQINAELRARKEDAQNKAKVLARAEIKDGFAFRIHDVYYSRYVVEKVCPKTVKCSKEVLRGGQWAPCSNETFKLEELVSLLAMETYEAC